MNPEEKIKNCEFYLYQLKHFEPDPYYSQYFFEKVIDSVDKFYQEIFTEANRDFGLFVNGNCDKNKFEIKAREKKDEKALEFISWFEKKNNEIHVNIFPNFIRNILNLYKRKKFPKIKIMLRAKERYKDDSLQEIKIPLNHGKIKSIGELKIEVQRQLPIFLEVINHKRQRNNEPKVNRKDVVTSVFFDIGGQNMEIVYAVETYIPLMKQFLIDARNQTKKLTQFG